MSHLFGHCYLIDAYFVAYGVFFGLHVLVLAGFFYFGVLTLIFHSMGSVIWIFFGLMAKELKQWDIRRMRNYVVSTVLMFGRRKWFIVTVKLRGGFAGEL